MNRNAVGACVLTLLVVTGCAAGISSQSKMLVTYEGSFSTIQSEPDRYVGETVLLGGRILDITPAVAETELVVLELPLNWQDRPDDRDHSQGRFLIQATGFLDPALYKPGALLSMVGTLNGSEIRTIGSFSYRYPRLVPIEIKLWPYTTAGKSPAFHFGVGVGTHF
jgi:outer membrane lipoprotein